MVDDAGPVQVGCGIEDPPKAIVGATEAGAARGCSLGHRIEADLDIFLIEEAFDIGQLSGCDLVRHDAALLSMLGDEMAVVVETFR